MKRLIIMSLLGALNASAWGYSQETTFSRDSTYEQNLRYQASADQTITPAKVIRWIMGLRGQALRAPAPTEFQPIVNVHDSNVRIIAAIAYKF